MTASRNQIGIGLTHYLTNQTIPYYPPINKKVLLISLRTMRLHMPQPAFNRYDVKLLINIYGLLYKCLSTDFANSCQLLRLRLGNGKVELLLAI